MIKKRLIYLGIVALVCTLTLSGILLVQAPDFPQSPTASQTQSTSISGYHLETGEWQVQGIASGTGYQLSTSATPNGTGTPCCCAYMPCIIH